MQFMLTKSQVKAMLVLADILESWGDRISVASAEEIRRLHKANAALLRALHATSDRLAQHHASRGLAVDGMVLNTARKAIEQSKGKSN